MDTMTNKVSYTPFTVIELRGVPWLYGAGVPVRPLTAAEAQCTPLPQLLSCVVQAALAKSAKEHV
jgi:hypothetical protein